MGKPAQFVVSFDKFKAVHFPRDIITGHLRLQLMKPMKVETFKLRFSGDASTFWQEYRTTYRVDGTSYTEIILHSQSLTIFEETRVLFGVGGENPGKLLTQGLHIYPFQFQLPDIILAASFEGPCGFIRYHVMAVIQKSKKFYNARGPIYVPGSLDLNTIPNMLMPSGASDSKGLCCWCCKSGPIELDFRTDRAGYVPGEGIIINATLSNLSDTRMKKMTLTLLQNVTLYANGRMEWRTKPIATIEGPACEPGQMISWSDVKILIPPLPPTDDKLCPIIHIAYSVKMLVHLGKFTIDLCCSVPVTIGTVPLTSLDMISSDVQSASMMKTEENSPADPVAVQSVPIHHTLQFMPSETQKSGKIDGKSEMGEIIYSPCYAYYEKK